MPTRSKVSATADLPTESLVQATNAREQYLGGNSMSVVGCKPVVIEGAR